MPVVRETIERYVVSEPMAIVGRRIRAAREAKGWSMRDAEPHIPISMQWLCKVENGQVNIGAETLHELAKALGTTVGKLFRGI